LQLNGTALGSLKTAVDAGGTATAFYFTSKDCSDGFVRADYNLPLNACLPVRFSALRGISTQFFSVFGLPPPTLLQVDILAGNFGGNFYDTNCLLGSTSNSSHIASGECIPFGSSWFRFNYASTNTFYTEQFATSDCSDARVTTTSASTAGSYFQSNQNHNFLSFGLCYRIGQAPSSYAMLVTI
jgi:hypothetical protein